MAAIDDVRGAEFWKRELDELAGDHGSTASTALRDRQARFLAAFVRLGGKTLAAAEVGMTAQTPSKWAKEDPVFALALKRSWEAFGEVMIAEGTRRGVEGVEVTVRDRHGAVVGQERKYSDDLIKFMLKGLDSKARWTQRNETAPAREGAWRQQLVSMLANPEARAKLEEAVDLMSVKPEETP